MSSSENTLKNKAMAAPDASLIDKPKGVSLDFFTDTVPQSGEVTKIVEGVYWLRMPLPMTSLDHINLWILKDGEGWAIVDTGLGSRVSQDIWDTVFKTFMKGRRVTQVICTHLHPDHTGLAGWICQKFGAPLVMTRDEYFLCRLMAADTGNPAPQHALDFYKLLGFTDTQLEIYKERFGGFGKMIKPMPHGFLRIKHGDAVKINGRDWNILVGSGHSPEHACLFAPDLKICLTGDQILPNISSNVSVWPTEPEGNPMQDWIDSCNMLLKELPEDTLICPAHGIPFRGAHIRLAKLIDHHDKALTRLREFCVTPMRAVDVFSCLFRREINDGNRLLAVGEAVAHLNCLIERGEMTRRINDAGQFTYKTRA